MTEVRQAVIFAGGRGERLRPLTDNMPKPMAPVLGRPFLDYLIAALVKAGITRVLILSGYCAEVITDYYGDGTGYGILVEHSVGTAEDLTGRRLLNAHDKLEDHFLLLYGDNYWAAPLGEMIARYDQLGFPVTTTVFSNKDGTGEYGFENNVFVDTSGRVMAYDKTRASSRLNGVDIGFFIVDKRVLDPREAGNISFEEKILTRCAGEGRLGSFVTDEQYYYITSIENLRRFEGVVRESGIPGLSRKA